MGQGIRDNPDTSQNDSSSFLEDLNEAINDQYNDYYNNSDDLHRESITIEDPVKASVYANMTIANAIAPIVRNCMLLQRRVTTVPLSSIDKDDLPEELKNNDDTAAPWDYIIGKISWSLDNYEMHLNPSWFKTYQEEEEFREKINEGLFLFGKYFRHLWV